jgi:hypothetical protein
MTNSAHSPLSSELDHLTSGKSDKPTIRHRNPQTLLTSVVVIARARDELSALTGYKADSVSGFARTDEGWRLTVTAIELHRIPPSTDLLATYEVTLNDAGDIVSYDRTGRYLRNQAGTG